MIQVIVEHSRSKIHIKTLWRWAGAVRVFQGWEHYISDVSVTSFPCMKAVKTEPIRAQYLDGFGPMRVLHSDLGVDLHHHRHRVRPILLLLLPPHLPPGLHGPGAQSEVRPAIHIVLDMTGLHQVRVFEKSRTFPGSNSLTDFGKVNIIV